MMRILDETGQQIVALLQKDGRTSNVEVARELGLSEGAVRKRLERLCADGIIRITAVADPAKLGLTTPFFVGIEADLAHVEDVAGRLAAIPEVHSVSLVTGTYDVIIEVVLPSNGQLLSFLIDKVSVIPGVKRTETYHVLRAVKRHCDWTIPSASSTHHEAPPQTATLSQDASQDASQDIFPGTIVVSS